MQYLLRQLHNTFLPQESLLSLLFSPPAWHIFYKPLKHYLSIVASSWCTRMLQEVLKGFSILRAVHN